MVQDSLIHCRIHF